MKRRIAGLLTAFALAGTQMALPALAANTDPTYRVYMARDGTSYTAEVTLENIAATYGTFGIRYDPTLFRYEGMTMADGLEVKLTHDEEYGATWSNDNGYKLFVWQAGGYDDTVFDTTSGRQSLCTMRFTLIGDESDIMLSSFGVMPWNETDAAIEYAQTLPQNNPLFESKAFYEPYWRYTDEQNAQATLGRGRLTKDKATVNGVKTKGFYQAAVNADLSDTEANAYFYDVKTVFKYGFPVNDPILVFNVIDQATRDPIEDALIQVYADTSMPLGTHLTDETGEAYYPEAVCDGSTYTYAVTANGYRPVPPGGKTSLRPSVTTVEGEQTVVTVEMEKLIYHVPKTEQPHIQVGGERFGYNGYDYHFRIEPAPGYRITKYPKTATVTVNDEVTADIPVDEETEMFTLVGAKLHQEALSMEQLTALGYDDVLPQPDENGYRSYDVKIEYSAYETEEVTYNVTANALNNGQVTYTHTASELPPTVDETHSKLIKTTAENRATGTFTFTADEGYKVEKVYINGLQIHTYDDETEFSYTFGEVAEDNDISVSFYDGTVPTNTSVMTLVVGEYGKANVQTPQTETNLTATRRVYLNPTTELAFSAEGLENYSLQSIVVEEGTNRNTETIYPDDTAHLYTFEPPDAGKDKTVYVNFKNSSATDTPTLYIKSYIAEGKGVIDPCGIVICHKGDEVPFNLTAADGDWRLRSIELGDFDLNKTDQVDYPARPKTASYYTVPLTESISVGAAFNLKGYWLKGYIDLGQAANLTEKAPQTGAEVTFERADGLKVTAKSTPSRHDSVFAAELPDGDWTVTVRKSGYVRYTITGFTFSEPAGETDVSEFAGGKKIIPLIGSTRTGTSVSLLDTAIVRAALTHAAKAEDMKAADVDDDGEVGLADMTYIMHNYSKRASAVTYARFLTE